MGTMNISLPDALKEKRGYGTSSEYVRELIRRDQDRLQLRGLLLAGAASAQSDPVDDSYFDGLRKRVRKAAKSRARG
jgi:antitoxin ParD1/3/4